MHHPAFQETAYLLHQEGLPIPLIERMASLSLTSAAGRVLRRSIFPRNPVRFSSDGVGRIESKGVSPKTSLDMAFEEFEENFRKLQEETRSFVEQEKLNEKRENRQRVLACFLVPTAFAVCIFGPDKKESGNEANH